MFDAPAGAQMSFFPSEAEQIQSIAEAESVTPSAFSMFISQDDIDHILRAGGNADAARMKIAAEFSKQKPLEDRAAFLKALYYGGNGLITDNGRFSAWYGDDGIHIATGDTSRYLRSAQVIGWADAAERIEELLDGGAFATNLEVTEAPRYERLGIAVDVWNLYHDFSDEAKSLGYLSCLGNIHSTSFPEETERLTDDLLNPAFRERLPAWFASHWRKGCGRLPLRLPSGASAFPLPPTAGASYTYGRSVIAAQRISLRYGGCSEDGPVYH